MFASLCRAIRNRPAALAALLAFAFVLPCESRAASPDRPIDGDLARPSIAIPPTDAVIPAPAAPAAEAAPSIAVGGGPRARAATTDAAAAPGSVAPGSATAAAPPVAASPAAAGNGTTWQKDDLIGAAQGVFGKGAAGLAEMIEDLLRKQGEPNGYIVGREGGGALIFGLRYGSGTLYHKVEGRRPVYWTGPSLGLDVGANAASTFVLVYNLYDTEELYSRFGAGEGQAYLIGGFHVSYLRRGDKVLIPVRSGAGLRLGLNAGYMKFSHRQNWLPF